MGKLEVRKRTIFIFLTLVGLLAYANTFRVPFHFDDIHFLKENILIKSFSLFLDWIIENPLAAISGRAFLLFTFYLNYLVSGLDTFGYHLTNITLHITTAFFFYLLIAHYVEKEDDPYHWKSVLAAVIFLVHPINTESVTYISSRSSELSTLLLLATLLLFAWSTAGTFRPAYYILSLACFVLGLATKSSVVVAPVLMLFFDLLFLSPEHESRRKRLWYHLPFLGMLLFAFYYYIGFIVHPEMYDRPWQTHILTELKVFVAYLTSFVAPVGLTIDRNITESASLDLPVLSAGLLLIGLLTAAVLIRNKNRVISFSLLWIFINLGPLMALRLTDYMADRWAYAASLGFALGVAEALFVLSIKNRKTAVAAAVSIALTFGVMTIVRNNAYRDPVSLWSDAMKKAPDNIRPYTNLAAAYMEKGEVDRAIEIMKRAIARGYREPETFLNLAMAYFLKDDLDQAERVLLSLHGKTPPYVYYYNLGTVYKQKKDYRRAIETFKMAEGRRKQSPAALGSIGECYQLLGDGEQAEQYYRAAALGIPQNAEDYVALAKAHFYLGDHEKGRKSLSSALVVDPLNIHIRNIIAASLLEGGNYDDAYKHYSLMMKMSPRYAAAYVGMGRAELGKGNKVAARTLFQKALGLMSPDSRDRISVEELLQST